jgi:hypothetical protein
MFALSKNSSDQKQKDFLLSIVKFSDESDLKLLTPSFFLPDVHKVVVPDCDSSDAKSQKRRLRFPQNLPRT